MSESTHNPPNPRRVLELLKEAGEQGLLAGDMARQFTIPDPPFKPVKGKVTTPSMSNLQRRLTWTNQILERQTGRGRTRRGGKEPSPYYNNVPTYRWFITEEGVGYLASGMAEGLRAARDAEVAQRNAELREKRRGQKLLITQAYVEYEPATTPVCVRERVIRELRAAGCTLDEIGGVFDVTRERVRQIMEGIRPGVCKCPRHVTPYHPEPGGTSL
jgi:ATP/maltotriose-dependent transcriptional regulator MalT